MSDQQSDRGIFEFNYDIYRALIIRQLTDVHDLNKLHYKENKNYDYNSSGEKNALYFINYQIRNMFGIKPRKKALSEGEKHRLRQILGRIKRNLGFMVKREDLSDLEIIQLIDAEVLKYPHFDWKDGSVDSDDEMDRIDQTSQEATT